MGQGARGDRRGGPAGHAPHHAQGQEPADALRDAAAARATIEQAIAGDPDNPWPQRLKTEICFAEGNRAGLAEAAIRTARFDQHNHLHYDVAVALARLNRLDEAIDHAARGRFTNPNHLFRLIYEAGSLDIIDETAPLAETPVIPRRFVQFRDKEEVPEGIAGQMPKWRAAYPGYEYALFSEARALEQIEAHGDSLCAMAIRVAEHPAQKSDIFRLWYLHRFGGIYIDADEGPAGDIGLLLQRTSRPHLFWLRDNRLDDHSDLYCTNWFLAAAPGSAIIGQSLGEAVRNTLLDRGNKEVHQTTGPYMVSRHIINAVLADAGASCSFIRTATGRGFVCRNVKWGSADYRSNTWQDFAGVPPAKGGAAAKTAGGR